METWVVVLASSVGTGLVTWGAIRVELRWLRRDVDHAHTRLDRIENALLGRRPGRYTDLPRENEGAS